MNARPARRRLVGVAELLDAFERGAELQLVLFARESLTPEEAAVVERARARGIAVRAASERERLRLTAGRRPEALLGLEGPTSRPSLDALMRRPGIVLVLVGLRYPGNVGFIVRAAEVAGAAGVVVVEAWTRVERASAMRFAMQADRYFPVLEAEAEAVVEAARCAGRRLVALETEGTRTPFEAGIDDAYAVFLGGEAEGVPTDLVARMDECLRIPMRGFIPSYNVQAAAAIVLGEWLRRTTGRDASGRPGDEATGSSRPLTPPAR